MRHDNRLEDTAGRHLAAGSCGLGVEFDQQFMEARRVGGIETPGKDRLAYNLGPGRGWHAQRRQKLQAQ